jgi:hypothetical protein
LSSDIADAFPQGDFIEVFRQSWLMDMIKETRTNRDYTSRTTEVAKWAREQVKRQIGKFTFKAFLAEEKERVRAVELARKSKTSPRPR